MALDYPTNSFVLILNFIAICLPNYYLSVYVFCKSQGIELKTTQIIYSLISGILFTILFVFVRINNTTLSHFLFFSLVPVLLSFLIWERGHLFKNLVIGLVSISFVSVLEVVSIIIQGSISWIISGYSYVLLTYLLSKVIVLILCVILMNIKRFKKGFQFFQEEKNLGIGLAISEIVMVLKCLDVREGEGRFFLSIVLVLGAITAGFGLYLWIRRSITAHYRERLQLKSEEHYKELLEECDKEIEKLNQSNEYLAKIVHRDNHLMNSLNTSIDSYLSSDDEEYKYGLLREIQTLARERGELIAKEQLDSKILPSTGNLLIDGAVNDLYIKAAAHGIDFNLTVSSTVDEIIGKYISQTDLQTLLCDHIKDAIIAVEKRGETGGKILVNLSKQNDSYCIDIYDNGVEFDVDTLSKLGLECVTTHSDTGGSGFGFMTTFETLKKAYASLIITEFENKSPFTKSVSFRFDGESAFIIRSYRSEELKAIISRNDIIFEV